MWVMVAALAFWGTGCGAPQDGVHGAAPSKGSHRHTVEVAAGEVLYVRVEQAGLDVRLVLLDAAGIPLRRVDSHGGDRGPEELWWRADTASTVTLVVEGSMEDRGPGGYRLAELSPGGVGPRAELCAEAQGEQERARKLGGTSRPEEAESAYRKAADLWQRAGEVGYAVTALRRVGEMWTRNGRPRLALDPFGEALDLLTLDAGQGAVPLGAEVQTRVWRGEAARKAGLFDDALTDFERALALDSRLRAAGGEGSPSSRAAALNGQGLIAGRRGDLERSRRLLASARDVYRERGWRAWEAVVALNLARLELRLDRAPEARTLIAEVEVLSESLGDSGLRAEVHQALGWWFHLQGESAAAVEEFGRGLALLGVRTAPGRSGSVPTSQLAAGLLDRLGTALVSDGRFTEADRAYRAALEFFVEGGFRSDEAHTRANLCRLALRDREVSDSAAVDSGVDGGGEPCGDALRTFRRLGETTAEAQVLFEMARAARSRGDLSTALEHARRIRALLDSVRARLGSLDLRRSISADLEVFDDQHVGILLDLHARDPGAGWDTEAFEVRDASRGRALAEMLREADGDLRRRLPPALGSRLGTLETKLRSALEQRSNLATTQGPSVEGAVLALDRSIDALVREYHEVQGLVRTEYPVYADLALPSASSRREIQRHLDDETLILSYDLGTPRSWVWIVGRGRLSVRELPSEAEIQSLVRAWYERASKAATLRYRRQAQGQAARRLATTVLAPVADALEGRRLVIVADEPLSLVPFTALPLPSTDRRVVESYQVVRLPSASTLVTLRTTGLCRPTSSRARLAVVADPVYGPGDPRLSVPPSVGPGPWPRLRQSSTEAAAILELLGSQDGLLLSGFDARRERVIEALEGFGIVHFATHAEIDARRPLLSRIVLSQFDPGGRPVHEELRALDLYGLDSRADLVVLSACRTVQQLRGEGLVGLTRGFMYAGTPRLVASLWRVEDAAARRLMEAFYGYLLAGSSPVEALRRAQSWMLEQGEDPHTWSGFVFLGDWRPPADLDGCRSP
ncbi:MAG: CHAT domain-containing tetratricopeptide repeat protein [Acidobacteriota bacterium]